jgi:hypothetical protein
MEALLSARVGGWPRNPRGSCRGLCQRSEQPGVAAYGLKVAAASCARRPALAWPPVDDHRAGLPGVSEAALLREAVKR